MTSSASSSTASCCRATPSTARCSSRTGAPRSSRAPPPSPSPSCSTSSSTHPKTRRAEQGALRLVSGRGAPRARAGSSEFITCLPRARHQGKPWRLGGERVCDNVTGNVLCRPRSPLLPPQPSVRPRSSRASRFAQSTSVHHDKARTEGLNEAHVRRWTEGHDAGRHRTRVTQRRDCSVVREPSAAEAQPSAEEAQPSADGRRCR